MREAEKNWHAVQPVLWMLRVLTVQIRITESMQHECAAVWRQSTNMHQLCLPARALLDRHGKCVLEKLCAAS